MRQNLLVQGAFLLLASLYFNAADAQLPDGSIAPDFTLTDIEGNEHNLYSYLDQGKKVILQFDATWNAPGWTYLTSGALQEVWETYGPDGTEEVMVFFLESDATTTISDLAGGSAATQGNWIAETPYPIIDNAEGVFNAYNNTFFPAIYTVCPNRRLTQSGQVSAEEHAAFLFEEDCEPATQPVAPKLWANAGGPAACAGEAQPFLVDLINMGTQPLTYVNLTLSDGAVTHNVAWYGNLDTYESTTVDLGSYVVEEGQDWYVLASTSESEDALELDLVIGGEEAISQFIRIDINTDNWGSETGWQVLDGAGDVVAEVEPFTVYASNSFYSEFVEVPVNECVTFVLNDAFGDGMNASQYEGVTADGNCTVYTLDGPGPASDISSVLFSYDGSTEFSTLYFPFSTDEENFTPGFPGCMDDNACNYEPQATLDDGSCLPFDPLKDCSGNCLQDCNGDGICDIIEGFESYDVGDPLTAVSPLWQLWDPDGSPNQESFVVDDAPLPIYNLSTFEGNVHSGAQSLMIEAWYYETVGDSTVEVREDVYLPIGEDESGILTFFYNPVSGAYFNVQEEVEPGIEWAFQVFWIPEGDGVGTCSYEVDFETVLEFPFTLGEWVELEHHFDLEANVMNLYVDGCFKGQLPYDGATIGGLDFYSYYGGPQAQGVATAFVDDLSFVPCGPPLVSSPGGCTAEAAANYDPAAEWDDGSCCYGDWADIVGLYAWSPDPGAIKIGPTPGSDEWYTAAGAELPVAQQNDRWRFRQDYSFVFETQGEVVNPHLGYDWEFLEYGETTWDWSVIDMEDGWGFNNLRWSIGTLPISGSALVQCGWMGVMDTGSEYEVVLNGMDSTITMCSPIRAEDCGPGIPGFITMTFKMVGPPDTPFCTEGCMDPLAINYDSNAQIDGIAAWAGGSCVYGNCDDVGDEVWDDSELGIFGFQDDTAYVGSPAVFEGIIHVPEQINQDGDTLPVVDFTDIELVTIGVPGLELVSVLEDVAGGSQLCVTISGTPEFEGNWLVQFDGQMMVEVFGLEVSLGTFSVQGSLEVLAPPMATDQEGCTYPGASNFDAEATIEDGSCLFAGCTNIMALNYSPWANADDGSCILDSGADECPDLDGNGNVTVSDLVIFLGYFGSACP